MQLSLAFSHLNSMQSATICYGKRSGAGPLSPNRPSLCEMIARQRWPDTACLPACLTGRIGQPSPSLGHPAQSIARHLRVRARSERDAATPSPPRIVAASQSALPKPQNRTLFRQFDRPAAIAAHCDIAVGRQIEARVLRDIPRHGLVLRAGQESYCRKTTIIIDRISHVASCRDRWFIEVIDRTRPLTESISIGA